ncbi:MAG: hypothetical protein Kow0059_08920 [Candidatus Sumerlaeia bacterium]
MTDTDSKDSSARDLRPAAPAPRKTDLRQGRCEAGALVRLASDAGLVSRSNARRNAPEACGVDDILSGVEK